jgi:DNA-binding NarL/FixJ family response regulator
MPSHATPRIVLVEDHTMVRQLFAHLIKNDLGLKLVADCTTIAEGTAALLKEKPDLAIIDWMGAASICCGRPGRNCRGPAGFSFPPTNKATSCARPSRSACTAS